MKKIKLKKWVPWYTAMQITLPFDIKRINGALCVKRNVVENLDQFKEAIKEWDSIELKNND